MGFYGWLTVAFLLGIIATILFLIREFYRAIDEFAQEEAGYNESSHEEEIDDEFGGNAI